MPPQSQVDIFMASHFLMKKKEHFITEIKDGKATTYVDCTSSIMNNVFNMSTDSSNPLKKSNFMTDRSATKNKANDILSKEIAPSSSSHSVKSFKCAVHPLLQFSYG